MATLTATEIEDIRLNIGDSVPTTLPKSSDGYDLSDTQIQAIWDEHNGHASEINSYKALYHMVRRRWGRWINQVDTQTEQGASSMRQKREGIKDLLDYYGDLAGVNTFTMSVTQGTFDFGLDQDDPETGEDLED
jgi:hypothetical protein